MKTIDKLKNFFVKKHPDGNSGLSMGKIIGLTLVAISNVSAITIGTLAWFNLSTRESNVDIASSDLNVEIRTLSAYKYVYPYYKSSTEFVDYDSDGIVKKYVLEDNTLEYRGDKAKDIAITSDDATITLGASTVGATTTNSAESSSSKVCIPSIPNPYIPEFRYYLVGDDLFNGVSTSWSLTDGYAFALHETATAQNPAVLDNIVVSEGSSFRLIEAIKGQGSTFTYHYYPLSSISEDSSPFRIIDDNEDEVGDRLLCLRSGIYKFTYSPNQLVIELHTSEGGKKDISVISNNLLDPTKISIDYAGSVDKEEYPDINSYMPEAIHEQNTMMVIDAELNFKNASEVTAGLRVERTDATSNSIYNTPNKYEDTANNLVGYVDAEHTNPLRASDFFNYYAVFTKTPYESIDAIWTALHHQSDANSQKFINGQEYDKTIDCTMHLKDNLNDSVIIPAIDPEGGESESRIYHCYIVIEYDHEHSLYFLDKNRLGKTYVLDRDFGFYFYGEQRTETQG